MDMEEIILENSGILEWIDNFVKETLKNKNKEEIDKEPACK